MLIGEDTHFTLGGTASLEGERPLNLHANGALNLKLAPEHDAALAALSRPALNFPHDYLKMAPDLTHAGATVNGETSTQRPMVPVNDKERY